MNVPLRALVIEDSEDDALLIADRLRRGGYDLTFQQVEDRAAVEAALAANEWDVIIADYRLPNFSGVEALELVRSIGNSCPFIIVSGQISEDTAVNAMRSGANDYVLKGNLARLVPAIERELRDAAIRKERKQVEQALRIERERTATILESITDAFYAVDTDWRFIYVNKEGQSILGKDWRSLIGRNIWEELPQTVAIPLDEDLHKAMVERVPVTVDLLYESISKWFSIRAYPSADGLSVYFGDITDQKLAEEALTLSRNELKEALDREHQSSLLLQRALLPGAPKLLPGYSVAVQYAPVYADYEIGGDFYDVFQVGESRAGVLLGDVAGKGLEAVAMAADTRSTLRAFVHETSSPGDAMRRANTVLYPRESGPAFVTVSLIVIDLCSHTLSYASAGHPPSIVCRADGTIEFLEIGQLPIGIVADQDFEEYSTYLGPGDKLIMYTDGIDESRRDGVCFEVAGMKRVLMEHRNLPVDELAKALLSAAVDWANGKLQDDAALVLIERLE